MLHYVFSRTCQAFKKWKEELEDENEQANGIFREKLLSTIDNLKSILQRATFRMKLQLSVHCLLGNLYHLLGKDQGP